jgi:ABC-type multidrug transport system fused ATPase/permease subunit
LGDSLVSTVAFLTIAILVIAMVNSFGDSMAEIYFARTGRALGARLRITLFNHLQQLSLAFHDRRQTGDVVTRVTGDVREIEEFMIDSVSDFIGSILLLIGTVGFLFYYSWQVTIVALLIIPIVGVITSAFSKRIKEASKRQRAREGDVASTTQEMLTSIRVVQTFGGNPEYERRFSHQSVRAMDAALDAARLQAWFSWIVSVFQAFSIGAVVWIGLWLNRRGLITLGILILFIILIQNMFKPTRKMAQQWNLIGKLYASVDRVVDLLERDTKVKDEPGSVEAPPLKGHVEFRNVSFSYEQESKDGAHTIGAVQALTDICLTLRPGEVVGLVGPTGAGKSTVAQLLPRLYDPQKGQVLIDGHDIRRFTLRSLRSQIGIVLQETILFSGTVADNIRYGRPDADFPEIVEAAKKANAHDFIMDLPQGYETELGERGATLSGGQRQRIAIARALIRNTPILILDEPTTGLDARSAEAVLSGLRSLMKGKTTLLISHDLGLIRTTDRIVVLENGRIEKQGTHESMVAVGGIYADLYARQFGVATPGGKEPSPDVRRAPAKEMTAAAVGAESGPEEADPLKSAALRSSLPTLPRALDPAHMREVLESSMLSSSAGRTIERLLPVKAVVEGPGTCVLRYEAETRAQGREPGERLIIGGRLFAQPAIARDFMRDQLAPLAQRGNGGMSGLQHGGARSVVFETPVAQVEELSMVLYAFPIDPALPTLVDASNEDVMKDVLAEQLQGDLNFGFRPSSLTIELARYPRRGHCLLLYRLRDAGSGSRDLTLYGKVGPPQSWHDQARNLEEVTSLEDSAGGLFRVPRGLAAVPEVALSVWESIPGRPVIASLISGRLEGVPAEAGVGLEQAIDSGAEVAGGLHGSNVHFSTRRTFEAELARLSKTVEGLRVLAPQFVEHLEPALGAIQGVMRSCPEMAPVSCHGDFTPSQILFDGDSGTGLVDFDQACSAEPAFDLGRFCAYVREACLKNDGSRRQGANLASYLCGRFLDHYSRVAGLSSGDAERLELRVMAYEVMSFVGMGVHGWVYLKPSRTRRALTLLGDRLQTLHQRVG